MEENSWLRVEGVLSCSC